jgi:hypothetical protein
MQSLKHRNPCVAPAPVADKVYLARHPDRAAMNRLRALIASLAATALLSACGPSGTPSPRIAEKANVTITFDGKRHACVVALAAEALGSAIACADLIPFLSEQLRLQSGAVYDIQTIAPVDDAEMAQAAAGLKRAGYRFIGDRSIPHFN